jgi:hypothetical protein
MQAQRQPAICGSLDNVRERIEFYAVNEHGETTTLTQGSGGLWCYRTEPAETNLGTTSD